MFSAMNIMMYSTESSKQLFHLIPDTFYIIIYNIVGVLRLTAREYQLRNGMDRCTESIAVAYISMTEKVVLTEQTLLVQI